MTARRDPAELTCRDCEAEGLPLTRKAARPGPRCLAHRRAFKKRASETKWAAYIGRTYNWTPEMYWALYEAQGGHCGLCQRATGKTKRLSIDHDHKCCPGSTSCGRCVRGLLCTPCNKLLGFARDTIDFFVRCIEYLTNPPAVRARIWRNKE